MLRNLFHVVLRLAVPPEFTVAFGHGGARGARGPVPPGWLADCDDLAHEFGLERGTIDAVRIAGRLQLRFSPHVPRGVHQRFRNVFGTYAIAR